jgi:hypothetical protein
MEFRRTYTIEPAPEPPMAWDTYERLVIREWTALLEGAPQRESALQSFFERHPCMLPGAFSVQGYETGHYPWLCALVSQPVLPSYDRRVPDFMWIALNSDTESPVLVEIESPGKRWFTSSGEQTANLTQALNQIAEWKAWFGVPRNVEAFKALYGLDRVAWCRRRFRPAYVLIYGRRAEATAKPVNTQKRGYLHSDDLLSMTYDRLRPNANARQIVCVSIDAEGVLSAKSVPPTLRWLPGLASDRALIRGFDRAIQLNDYISPARKSFLIRRLEYWNEWARRDSRGIVGSEDGE